MTGTVHLDEVMSDGAAGTPSERVVGRPVLRSPTPAAHEGSPTSEVAPLTGALGPSRNSTHSDTQALKEGHPANLRRVVILSLSVCAFYITVSSSIVFANKALSYTYKFRSTNTLLFMQMIFSILILHFARDVVALVSFQPFSIDKAYVVLPVSVFYCINAAVALAALRELSVPSYTLIKRMAPIFTLGLESLMMDKKPPNSSVVLSLGVMTLGTVIAFNGDATSPIRGWVYGLASCLFQALYLIYARQSGAETGLNAFGILYYHSIISLPLLVILILGTGELKAVFEYEHWAEPNFLIVLVVSLLLGFLLNYALFLCNEKTSSTSTLVSGHVKATFQTVLGFFTFGGVEANAHYLLGTLLNISGGVGYGLAKFHILRAQQQQPVAAP